MPVYVFDGFHLAFYVSRVAAFVRCFYVNVYEVEATIEKFQRLFALCGEVCALCACCAGHEGHIHAGAYAEPLEKVYRADNAGLYAVKLLEGHKLRPCALAPEPA